MRKQNPFLDYLKPKRFGKKGPVMASMPQADSPIAQTLGNTIPKEGMEEPKPNLPRHSGNSDFDGNAIKHSLDNVNYNKQAKRNVASDDWFHIGSRPNRREFF